MTHDEIHYSADKRPEGGIHASIPALPDCTVEAENRDDAIRMAREAIVEMVSRSEIVQVDVPQQPKTSSTPDTVPWEWFGAAKDDAKWNPLFDEVERNRDETRKT